MAPTDRSKSAPFATLLSNENEASVSPRRAAELLTSHHRLIARTVAGQIQAVIPKYREIDPTALTGSLSTMVRALAHMIESGDEDRFIDIACDIAEMRLAGGFKVGDMVGAGICFLPVLRRFFQERCRTLDEAMGAYALCEEHAMPTVSRFANAFAALEKLKVPVGANPDAMRTQIRETISASSSDIAAVPVMSTFDFMLEDDDEITVPDGKR